MENDLIRRSELLAKKCVVRGHLDTGSPYPSKVVAIPVDVIERAPAVDAVEVVRCKDCKHMKIIEGTSVLYCLVWLNVNGFGDHGYCNYGERKEGAENG